MPQKTPRVVSAVRSAHNRGWYKVTIQWGPRWKYRNCRTYYWLHATDTLDAYKLGRRIIEAQGVYSIRGTDK